MPDPAEGLEPDVTVIENEADRKAEQMKYFGGDEIDDNEDLDALDRGDNVGDATPENEDRGDEVSSENEGQKDESEDEADEAEGDEADAEDDDSDADAAEDEDAVEGDDEGDDGLEDDGDDDDSEDGDDDESDDSEERDPGIPRQRFNEVNERRKAAEQELAELKARDAAKEDATVEKFDFDTAEEEYMELLLDGKTKEAGAKRREIRTAEQEVFKQETRQETLSDVNEQAQLADLNELSVQAEEMYPIFDETSSDYDPVVSQRVVTYMKGYMQDGQALSDAFVSGLADVIDQYDLNGTRSASVDEEPAPKKTVTKKAPIKKTKEKIEAAKQQGKSPAGNGEGSADRGVAAPSIEDMSDDDLDKLDAKQLAVMRGDYVE